MANEKTEKWDVHIFCSRDRTDVKLICGNCRSQITSSLSIPFKNKYLIDSLPANCEFCGCDMDTQSYGNYAMSLTKQLLELFNKRAGEMLDSVFLDKLEVVNDGK